MMCEASFVTRFGEAVQATLRIELEIDENGRLFTRMKIGSETTHYVFQGHCLEQLHRAIERVERIMPTLLTTLVPPEETSVLHPWSVEIEALTRLSGGSKIWPNHPAFADLNEHGLIQCEGNPSHGPGYVIAPKGQSIVDTNEERARVESELNSEERELLGKLVAGDHIFVQHPMFPTLHVRGMLWPLVEDGDYFTISAKGRRALTVEDDE